MAEHTFPSASIWRPGTHRPGQDRAFGGDPLDRIDLGGSAVDRNVLPARLAASREINQTLREPAVKAETGGARGGGAVVTAVGKRMVDLYRAIEVQARTAAGGEFRAMGKLIRHEKADAVLPGIDDPHTTGTSTRNQ